MSIFIYKNEEQLGPYTRDEIVQRINNGTFLLNDMFWEEGNSEWAPLSSMFKLSNENSPPPPPSQKSSFRKKGFLLVASALVICLVVFFISSRSPAQDLEISMEDLSGQSINVPGEDGSENRITFDEIYLDVIKSNSQTAPYKATLSGYVSQDGSTNRYKFNQILLWHNGSWKVSEEGSAEMTEGKFLDDIRAMESSKNTVRMHLRDNPETLSEESTLTAVMQVIKPKIEAGEKASAALPLQEYIATVMMRKALEHHLTGAK